MRETVPDSILDRADDIELIDLTPDDLIQRLKEGKVYVPKQAERALEHYFSPGNLTALRELALRRTAQRVDEQLLTHMRAHAIAGPWAAGERVLVCVSEDPRAAGLVRYAKRLADRLHAPWTALYVETRRSLQLSSESSATASPTRCGWPSGSVARPSTIPGGAHGIADDIVAFARANNVTQIVIGKSDALALVRDAARLGGARSRAPLGQHQRACHRRRRADGRADPEEDRRARPRTQSHIRAWPYVAALAVRCGRARRRPGLLDPCFGVESVDLVFLTAVVGVAVRFGLWPSLFASVAASLCYNFFFLPPIYTFTIADPTNVAAFVFFIVVAVVVSNLAARVRSQAVIAVGRARTTEALYAFSRKLAGVGTLDECCGRPPIRSPRC